ncbi:MAG: hypothetical protein EB089_07950, partial [Acidimicrobiia bacterium]|nr:hypothetical protein [Acidimicrobiia bacterium]
FAPKLGNAKPSNVGSIASPAFSAFNDGAPQAVSTEMSPNSPPPSKLRKPRAVINQLCNL